MGKAEWHLNVSFSQQAYIDYLLGAGFTEWQWHDPKDTLLMLVRLPMFYVICGLNSKIVNLQN